MSTFVRFDHYSDQRHDSVRAFITAWCAHGLYDEGGNGPYGGCPWNGMSVPLQVWCGGVGEECRILVYHPRKEHVKWVNITCVQDEHELEWLMASFVEAASLFDDAAEAMRDGCVDDDGELALYYWR